MCQNSTPSGCPENPKGYKMNRSPGDAIRIQKGLLTAFLIVTSVILARFAIAQGNPLIGLLIPGLLLLSQLLARPAVIFMSLLFINTLKLIIPGLPTSLTVLVLAQSLMIGWALLDVSIKHQKHLFSYKLSTDIWLAVFLLNIVLLMAVRGAGFARMGGSVYGGAQYLQMIMMILFYFSAVRIRLSEKQMRKLIWFLFFGALIYAALEMLVYYFSGQLGWISQFVSFAFGSLGSEYFNETEATAVRWHSFRGLAFAMLPIAYTWIRQTSFRFFMGAVAFILVGLSGFRSILVQVGAMIFLASIYYSKSRGRAFFLWMLAGLAVLGFLIVATPYLPLTMQRTVSFLPFLNVDPEVLLRAEGSANWRFDMWRDYCIPNVPKYLLIGRGLAQDISGFAWLSRGWYGTSEFFYHMGSYHSGPFDLLLTYGLMGTVSFTLFFLFVVLDGWKTVRVYASHQNTFTARYFTFLTLWLTYEFIAFYLIFGGVTGQLFLFLSLAVQMRIIKKNLLMGEPGVEVSEVRNQRSEVSLAAQQPPMNNRTSANRWARPPQRKETEIRG